MAECEPLLNLEDSQDDADSESEETEMINETEETSFSNKYDLFISYSSDDHQTVSAIVQELERRFKLRCMFADRDFVAGQRIDENINEKMKQSKKTLMVLSPNFLESKFCNYETQVAIRRAIEQDSNYVIPLMIEPCKNIPECISHMTYIDAGNTDDVVAKIIEAYLTTPSRRFTPNFHYREKKEKQNGWHVLTVCASKVIECKLGNQWEFQSLTENQLQKVELSSIQIGPIFDDLIEDLNDQRLFEHYGAIYHYPQLFLAMCLVTFTSYLIGIAFIMLLLIILRTDEYVHLSIILLLIFGCLLSIFGVLLVRHHIKRKLAARNFILDKHQLEIIRYDTEPCTEFLTTWSKDKILQGVTHEEYAANQIENSILRNQKYFTDDLYYWMPYRITVRHETYGNKKCFCQMIAKV